MFSNEGGKIQIPREVISMVNRQEIKKWSAIRDSMSQPIYDTDPRAPIWVAVEAYIAWLEERPETA